MLSSISLYFVYLTSGLSIGFGHCIGMCGPVVVALNFNLDIKRKQIALFLYHCGRISTYTLIGGFMGASGAFTVVATKIEIIQKIAMIASGGLIVVIGLGTYGIGRWGDIVTRRLDSSSLVSIGFKTLSRATSTFAYYPIGLLLGLLPCGPVYTALIGAAGAGMEAPTIYHGIFTGMGLMAVFGIGTVPALLLVSKISDWGIGKYRQIIYKFGSAVMIALGIYFIVKGLTF